jgi:hypothetical protein
MSLGDQLQQARKQRRMTTSAVASATRMKIQIVEDLEREDFTRIAAPVYGKGFIRLYAEHVGLDPKPLVDEYVARFVDPDSSSLRREPLPPPQPKPMPEPAELPDESGEPLAGISGDDDMDLFSHAHGRRSSGPGFLQSSTLNRRRVSLSLRPVVAAVVRGVAAIAGRVRRGSGGGRPDGDESGEEVAFARGLPIPLLKVVFISIGALFVVILVASGVRQCVRSAPPSGSEPPPPEELRIAVPPPEPYME